MPVSGSQGTRLAARRRSAEHGRGRTCCPEGRPLKAFDLSRLQVSTPRLPGLSSGAGMAPLEGAFPGCGTPETLSESDMINMTRRAALCGIASISATAGTGAALAAADAQNPVLTPPTLPSASPDSVMALIEKHRAAAEASDRAAEFLETLHERFGRKPPAVQVGWLISMDGAKRPNLKRSEREIVEHFDGWAHCRRDARERQECCLAELTAKQESYQRHRRDFGFNAAELEDEAAYQAKVEALDALIACQPTTLEEASLKAIYLAGVIDFESPHDARRAFLSLAA